MSILSGWIKTRKYLKTADGYKKQSLDTSSETVYMNDGNTAETNLGAIQGITSDVASNSNSIAASTSITHNLQGQIGAINNNLTNIRNITQLFTGTVTAGGTITLTESYKNFRYIIFSVNSGGHLVYPVTPVQGNYIKTGFVVATSSGLPTIVTINITNITNDTQLPLANCYITNMAQGGTWYPVQNANIVRVYGVNRL